MQESIQVTIVFRDPNLDDEEIQATTQRLLPQIEEVDGVERVTLVAIDTAPLGSKSVGGFLLGAFTATVNTLKLRPLWQFLSNRLADKTLEATFKAPDGREFTGKAKSREDFEYLLQQAEEYFKR